MMFARPLQSQAMVVSAIVLLTATVACLDYITGTQIRVFPLYYLPIGLAAWKLPRRAAILAAVGATVAWEVSNSLASEGAGPVYVQAINICTQLLAFLLIGLMLSTLRRRSILEASSSRTDALTGLSNRRGFAEHAEFVLRLARRAGQPLTIAYIDLDSFKLVNDWHGHETGDRALRLAAEVLREAGRASDLTARLGGDEFVMVLPDTGPEAATQALERLRLAMAARMKAQGWPVTASIGAVCFATTPATLEQAIHAADTVMYEVKEEGKDRVRVIQG